MDIKLKWDIVIGQMKNDNTYKLAWGIAFLENIYKDNYVTSNEAAVIEIEDIANRMLKYYWNQEMYTGYVQGRSPVIVNEVKVLIHQYKKSGEVSPIPWSQFERQFYQNEPGYNIVLSSVIRNINENVCPKFLNVNEGKVVPVYEIVDKTKISLPISDIKGLKEISSELVDRLKLRWYEVILRFNENPDMKRFHQTFSRDVTITDLAI